MTDEVDSAQAREEADRDRALSAARQRIADSMTPRDPAVALLCIDCDQPIEPERLQVLGHATSRCASCAQDFEQRMRRQR